jgi:hypothetical protein
MKFLWLNGMLDLGRQKGRVFSAPLTRKNISINLWILEQRRRRRKRRKRRGREKVRRKMRRLKREIRTEEDD